jgi:hypothetical protein
VYTETVLAPAADACPYCLLPVNAAGDVTECRTCGGALREAEPGVWQPLVDLRGAQRIRELEHRIDRVRITLGCSDRPALLAVAMPLLLLGALEFALARLGTWARAAGQGDAFFLVVVAAGLVAFAIYMIAESAWTRFRQDRARRRALARLRSQRNLARHRTSNDSMRGIDHPVHAAVG